MEDIRGVTSGRALFTSRTKSDYRTCSARAARFTDLAVFIRETFTFDRGTKWPSKSIQIFVHYSHLETHIRAKVS